MSKYLVVANQTVTSEELTRCLLERADRELGAQFVLVVPATPVEHLLTPEQGEATQIAARRAGRALTHLTDAGVPVVGAYVGGASLITAIDDAIRERVSEYAGIILCTLPIGTSRWFEPDLVQRLEFAFHLPVTHVVASHPLAAV